MPGKARGIGLGGDPGSTFGVQEERMQYKAGTVNTWDLPGRGNLGVALLCCAWLGACGGKGEDSGGADGGGDTLPGGGGETGEPETCGGTAPVITDVQCAETGLVDDEAGVPTPYLLIMTTSTDVDGDLHRYSLGIYFDDTLDDDTVSTDNPVFNPLSATISEFECSVNEGNIGVRLLIPGGDPTLNTNYEWGLVLSDANGDTSEMAVIDCSTPKADGTAGDGTGT